MAAVAAVALRALKKKNVTELREEGTPPRGVPKRVPGAATGCLIN